MTVTILDIPAPPAPAASPLAKRFDFEALVAHVPRGARARAPVAHCTHCGHDHSYPFLETRTDPVARMACPACNRTGSVPLRRLP